MVCGDRTQSDAAQIVQQVIVRDASFGQETNPALVETAFDELLHELGSYAGGHKRKECVGLRIRDLLQKRRKIGVGKRNPQILYLSASFGKGLAKCLFDIDARTVIRDNRYHPLDTVL